MKKNTFILSLLAISMLSACVWETKRPHSLATDTSIEEGPEDELIIAGMYDPKLESDDHVFYFRVPEFTERFNLVIGSSMSMLYYGDTRIGENLHYDPYIYASDINGDGYREIVFAHNEMRSDGFTVYDIKNAKTLFSQEDMTVEKFGRFASYQYALDIREGELVFLPVLGHFMGPREFEERKIVDWGHLKWSEEKGCYFKWDNVYEIRQIILDSICLKGDDTRLVMDSDLKDGELLVTLDKLLRELFKLRVCMEHGRFPVIIISLRRKGAALLRDARIGESALPDAVLDPLAVIIERHGEALDFSAKQLFQVRLILLQLMQDLLLRQVVHIRMRERMAGDLMPLIQRHSLFF